MTSNSLTMSEKTNRYIDPLTDFGFKHFFGSELNKEILLKFLNAVFEEKKEIVEVIFVPVEINRDKEQAKDVLSDLLCKEKNGKQFTVLIRRIEKESFRESSRKFMARFFKEAEAPDQKSPSAVKEHYLLGLIDFSFGDCEDMYYREISFAKTDLRRNPAGKLGFKFLEIPEFHKSAKALETDMDKWFYLLKHLRHLNQIPKKFQDESFRKIFEAAEVSALAAEQQAVYAADLKKRKHIFKVYDPDQAANEALQREMDEGNLDEESKAYFLEVFRMGYETGFEEGMLEIANEIGSVF